MKPKFYKHSYFFYIAAAFWLLVIFFFSWINNPDLSISGLLPEFVTNWTDKQENDTLRTGVPFLFFSIIIGIKLLLKKASLRYWIVSFLSLVAVVCIAEIGQLFLPTRFFDLKDIYWGSAASFVGLLTVFLFSKGLDLIKQKK